VLRKLSEFLCSTNVGPEFFPIDRPAEGSGSMYGRYLGKSVQFEAQTVGRRKSPQKIFLVISGGRLFNHGANLSQKRRIR